MQMKSMAAVALATSGLITSIAAGDAVEWRVADGGNGHWYRFIPDLTISWGSAASAASAAGGHLATITASTENTFVFAYLNSVAAWVGVRGPFLGGLQERTASDYSEPQGGWRWVTDEFWNSASWAQYGAGEPNNDFGVEDALAMDNRSGSAVWNDVALNGYGGGNQQSGNRTASGYLIEWSADCNNDGIVDYGQCRDGSLPDFNGNNIPDCCEEGTACVVGQFPTQWKISEGGNGHWYRLNVGGPFTWTAARALAEARGGYLGTVTSAAEDRFIRDLIRVPAAFDLFVGPWLGGYQDVTAPDYSEPAGGWRWVTGEPWYAGWTGVEPNGGPLENLLHIAGTAPNFNDLNWNDFYEGFPTQPRSCVIEWSSDCNSDGIVDYGQILNGELADANDNGVPDICEQTPCPGDIAADGVVNGVDLAAVLNNWGTTGGALGADANGDGVVDGADLALVLNSWGPCPK